MFPAFVIIVFAAAMAFIYIPRLNQQLKKKLEESKGLTDHTDVSPMPLVCYDCKHCIKLVQSYGDYSKCSKIEKQIAPDTSFLVTGKTAKSGDELHDKYYYCSSQRSSRSKTDCQKEARYFEPKEIEGSPKGEKPNEREQTV
jgi:hypothetical protein